MKRAFAGSVLILPEFGEGEKRGGLVRALRGRGSAFGRRGQGSDSRAMIRGSFEFTRSMEIAMANDMGFIDPTAGGSTAKVEPAPRPADLSGKVVGLLDNTKEQADIILDALGSALRERYDVAKVVSMRKEHYSKPATDEMIEEMSREVDVAIAALGG